MSDKIPLYRNFLNTARHCVLPNWVKEKIETQDPKPLESVQ